MEEPRLERFARQHGIRQKRDDGGMGKTLAAYIRRADEGTLSRLLVETSTHRASNPEFEKLLHNTRVVGFDTGG